MTTLTPQRRLKIEGTYNVRDIGGYKTADGRTTRWKTYLRADSLHNLKPQGQQALVDYGIKTVVDLRRVRETVKTPNVFATSKLARYVHHNMITDTNPATYGAGEGIWLIYNSYIVLLEERKPQIKEIMTTLSEPDEVPALFHCAGGTDRTGIVASMLLGTCGVPDETISEDYGLSAEPLWERYLVEGPPDGYSMDDLTKRRERGEFSPPEAMMKTLEHIRVKYGGIDDYLSHIGITEKQMNNIRRALVG
ncbi:MAG: tyrosine-protein phosphatase [SAR202 cluster bacterium]|nr:tyrosine-protein phosphatase [SAR202 cluster bacterium]